MAAADYFVHRHHDTDIPEDHLDIWRRIPTGNTDVPAAIQINQANGVTAAVHYRKDDADAIARAILEAVGIDPRQAFTGDLPELQDG